jgi:hypothetical protein
MSGEELNHSEPGGPPPAGAEKPVGDREQSDPVRQSHAAHVRGTDGTKGAARPPQPSPAHLLPRADPDTVARFERLDDLVYEAIGGSESALEELQTAWPQLRTTLDDELLLESRQEYLHYALSIWKDCVGPEGITAPGRALPSLEVLCLLFDEA